jgi:asparagine synthase (glutamine-hydrolysing)
MMWNKWVSLLKLVILEPRLTKLAWQLKRSKKTYLSWSKIISIVDSFYLLRKRWPRKSFHVGEFGVGRGGSAMLLGWLVGRYGGTIALYDVFGQIPAPTEMDGEQAQQRYEKIIHREEQEYYGNIPDLLEVILSEISRVCPRDRIEIIQGRYEDVLPYQASGKTFDLVHIDCDWYESSRVVLAYLKDHLSPGAIIQIDDYGHWEGSRKAYEEASWLSQCQAIPIDNALVVDTGKEKQPT